MFAAVQSQVREAFFVAKLEGANPVAANVRRLRGKTKQDELAALAGEGWNQQLISQIETGRWQNPSYEKLKSLAAALGVTVADLYAEPVPDDAQLPLVVNQPAHEQVLADLIALAQDRPDLRRTLRELRETLPEESYRQALVIIWRHMAAGIETARELLISTTPARHPSRQP